MNNKLRLAVYHSDTIQAWEKRWFAQNNSAYGLMQQAAFLLSLRIMARLQDNQLSQSHIRVWCGQGNNAGDGYLLAVYLSQKNYQVDVYATDAALTEEAKRAQAYARAQGVKIYQDYPDLPAQVHIDALFGIGLNRALTASAQQIIALFNQQIGLKLAIDIPSGLHPNTGMPFPVAIRADYTYSFLGLKTGLVIGQAAVYVGQCELIPLIPEDDELEVLAYWNQQVAALPQRLAHQHKGSFGHVLVIGGHPQMGGAVIMSAEAAMHSGAGKVTVLCDAKHHMAVLARSPNVMLNDLQQTDVNALVRSLQQIDSVCFGMGLGRDAWGEQNYHMVVNALQQSPHIKTVVWDADALWFLANHPHDIEVQPQWIFTPHSGEAARLLNCTVADIERDRIAAIKKLQQHYGGQWVLKGAGSLTLEPMGLSICGLGNAGMGTAGMGDVLAGMMAGLKGQFEEAISVADIVALHAAAGDVLAQHGMRGLQAQDMAKAIYQVVN